MNRVAAQNFRGDPTFGDEKRPLGREWCFARALDQSPALSGRQARSGIANVLAGPDSSEGTGFRGRDLLLVCFVLLGRTSAAPLRAQTRYIRFRITQKPGGRRSRPANYDESFATAPAEQRLA